MVGGRGPTGESVSAKRFYQYALIDCVKRMNVPVFPVCVKRMNVPVFPVPGFPPSVPVFPPSPSGSGSPPWPSARPSCASFDGSAKRSATCSTEAAPIGTVANPAFLSRTAHSLG